jgi:adenylate cyclase
VLPAHPPNHAIASWLLSTECRALGAPDFLAALAERLVAAGVPLLRVSTSILTKHPEVFVANLEWRRGMSTASVTDRRHAIMGADTYRSSPVAEIHSGVDTVRARLAEGDRRFPVFDELREGGSTDYYAVAIVLGDGKRTYFSCTTDEPRGFTDDAIALIESLRPALAARLELAAAHHSTQSLLEVYLGKNAAARVLSGSFRRGTGELVPCAIVFGDMRGFTSFADRRSPAEVVSALDGFFETVASPIHEEGGEILKFIGDAVLAVFRTEGSSDAEACARALRAAERAIARVEARPDPFRLGVALHFGEVLYGNIGAQDRLDFTVIGAAVNEASRIEGLCKVTGKSLLMSDAFVHRLPDAERARTTSAGEHAVKGVGAPVAVHTVGAPASAS